ncbi:hypothetical protein [Subtercola boreus]|uniref:hypothetical protein n=1 Tax=Subtercola boreus TaxID=120213 RepID=UPI000E2A3A4B|nr:hypothetical protein [Subtercola boreus]
MWQQSSDSHVREVFRRVIRILSDSEDGHLAALQFTLFLRHITPAKPDESSTILGQPVNAAPQPIGTALIVSAPSCDSFTIAENVAAALAARNCVELALFEHPAPDVAALIRALQHVLPEGVFTVLSERTGWGGRGPDTAIIILTPDRALLNDRPWVSSRPKSSQQAMVSFYSR